MLVLPVILIVSLALVGCAKPAAPEAIELNYQIALAYHPGDYNTDVVLKLAELCESYTGGRLKLKLYYPGDIYPTYTDMAVAVEAGEADLTFVSSIVLETLGVPEVAISAVPYPGADMQTRINHQRQWWTQEPSGPKIQKLVEAQGVKWLDIVLNGPTVIVLNTEAMTKEEWSKLKLRSPNMDIYLLMSESTGAHAVPLAYSEVPMALKTGVVDGLLTGQVSYEADRLWEDGADCFPINLVFMATCYSNFINLESWQKLPPDIQQIITEKIMPELDTWADKRNAQAIADGLKVIEENAVVYELSSSRLAEIREALVQTLHPKYQELDPELYNAFKEIAGF